MRQYKVLQSVAHKWAHSRLSDGTLVGGTIPTQHLLEAARAHGQWRSLLDPLSPAMRPEEIVTPPIAEGLAYGQRLFRDILQSQGGFVGLVSRVELELEFDLTAPSAPVEAVNTGVTYAKLFGVPEAAACQAEGLLVDDRGRQYRAKLPELWRAWRNGEGAV